MVCNRYCRAGYFEEEGLFDKTSSQDTLGIYIAQTLLQACADPGRNIAMELNTGYGSRDIKTSLRQVFGFKSVLIQVIRQVLTTWINATILGHMDLCHHLLLPHLFLSHLHLSHLRPNLRTVLPLCWTMNRTPWRSFSNRQGGHKIIEDS